MRVIQRLFHRHYYQYSHPQNGWPKPSNIYICADCGKNKEFIYPNSPLNAIMPTEWEAYNAEVAKGNAAYVMSPPIRPGGKVFNIYGDEV